MTVASFFRKLIVVDVFRHQILTFLNWLTGRRDRDLDLEKPRVAGQVHTDNRPPECVVGTQKKRLAAVAGLVGFMSKEAGSTKGNRFRWSPYATMLECASTEDR